jgi:hypothetical protein
VSVTFAARTVTVQLSFRAKASSGSSVNVRGPPVAVAACVPDVAQAIENQSPVVETSSLNVMSMSASSATSEAPDAGSLAVTRGAWSGSASQDRVTELLRGAVAAASKSAALSSLSTHPPFSRCAEVVLEMVGAPPVPSKKFAFP